MTITDEIIIIANQLANQGKKPTVALVKTKLKTATPLPTIISVLRHWTHDPKLIELTKDSKEVAQGEQPLTPISPEIKRAIELAIKPIEAELSELKALVIQLTKQKNKD